MNHELELELQAYLDGELSPSDTRRIAQRLEQDRDAQLLLTELRNTHDALAGNELSPALPESREFFWSKIQREIQRETQPAPRAARPAWLRWPRFIAPFAGAAAAVALLMFSLRQFDTSSSLPASDGTEVAASVDAITFHDYTSGMTVVWLQPRGFTESN